MSLLGTHLLFLLTFVFQPNKLPIGSFPPNPSKEQNNPAQRDNDMHLQHFANSVETIRGRIKRIARVVQVDDNGETENDDHDRK